MNNERNFSIEQKEGILMNKLFVNEYPLLVMPTLATKVGLIEFHFPRSAALLAYQKKVTFFRLRESSPYRLHNVK